MPEVLQDVKAFPETAKLTGKVHRLLGLNPSPFTGPGTNTYLIGMDGRGPLLLDTGSGREGWPKLLQGHLAECGSPPLLSCLMTHGHPDHIGGAEQVRGIYPDLPLHKHPWPEQDGPWPTPLLPIADGDTFSGEGYTLTAHHTPGHAPDHLCFVLEEERALFTGDVILGVGTTVIPRIGGDLGQYLDTLRRLLTLDRKLGLKKIYPGHGPVIDNPTEKISYYLEHRLERERQILGELEGGAKTVAALVRSIYREYPESLHAAAGQSVASHLDKLEKDRMVEKDSATPPHYVLTS